MSKTIVVIGAGAGGLSSAIRLAAAGHAVTVLERQSDVGGKMRPLVIDGDSFDSGPTVLTMRWAFEELFASAGAAFEDHVKLTPLHVLARHFWSGGKQLDLHADQKMTTAAIGSFAGPEAATGYQAFARDSKRIHNSLRDTFMRKQRPTLLGLASTMPLTSLLQINPYETLWSAMGRYFKDPLLQQLFGRYSTYCGTSPFKAPATLMLVADVEAQGVWRAEGGMGAVAKAMRVVAERLDVTFHFNCEAKSVAFNGSDIAAVMDSNGSRHSCSEIILNADSAAAAAGFLGPHLQKAASPLPSQQRSSSAITWCVKAKASGPPLDHHNVFFSDDYVKEFRQLEHAPADDPTVYLCEQGDDRKLILINAPANSAPASDSSDKNMQRRLARCGLEIDWEAQAVLRHDPKTFNELYPATAGALYGRAANGWLSTFQRAKARTAIPGLYLAGGYTHPGPGVPMAILSGQLAAEALLHDQTSQHPFRRTAIAGGTSTR